MHSSNIPPPILGFIEHLKFEKRYSLHTVRAYEDDLMQFYQFLGAAFNSQDIVHVPSTCIRTWLASLRQEGVTARTIRRKSSALRSFFKYLIVQGALQQTPMSNFITPKISKRLPSYVPEKELSILLGTLQYSDDWKGLNAKLLIHLFYNTGMRLSELILLKKQQVDMAGKAIKILGKGNKERVVPVSADIIEMIRDYDQEKRKQFEVIGDILLVTEKGKPLYPKYAYLIVHHYLNEIKTLEKKSPHVLRHSFATHLTNAGAPINAVKELLGHASLSSTQIYTHNSIDHLKDVYAKAHPKAKK